MMNMIKLTNKNNTVLRNGFVKLIDCMPRVITNEAEPLMCDSAVVQAARVSYNTGLKDIESDTKLIRYLLKHRHTSPFEMVKFKFHLKALLFVTIQWFRLRMGNFNEISGRFTVLKVEFYNTKKVSSQSEHNKQLSANDNLLSNPKILNLMDDYLNCANDQYYRYEELIKNGVSRETARIGLPLNLFTEFYWSIDLHNLLNFIKLRDSKNSQYEIQEYAKNIKELITDLCPITMGAYDDYLDSNVMIYKHEMKHLTITRNLLKIEEFNLTKKENDELNSKIDTIHTQYEYNIEEEEKQNAGYSLMK